MWQGVAATAAAANIVRLSMRAAAAAGGASGKWRWQHHQQPEVSVA